MEKKKRSAGSIIAGFFRGLAILLLCLVLIISVTVNIQFYADDSVVNIKGFGKDYCFFLNNNKDLSKIENGSLIFADKKMALSTNTYVLCEVTTQKGGKPMKHKTVLALASEVQNDNGSISYEVLSNNKPEDKYVINKNKIIGTVIRPYDFPGKCITFIRSIYGIIATVAVPAFLLILLCAAAISANKERYEDDLSEARILADELRRSQNKGKSKKKKELPEEEPVQPESEALPEDYNEFNDGVNPTYETYNFEEEANKKAMELNKALAAKQNTVQEPESAPVQNEPVFQEYRSEDFEKVEKPAVEEHQPVKEPEKQPEPAYSKPSSFTDPSVPQNRFTASLTSNAIINEIAEEVKADDQKKSTAAYQSQPAVSTPAPEPVQASAPVQTAAPVYSQPAQTAAPAPQKKIVRKKVIKQRPVQKLNANSIDDLIKIIDSEKEKL